METHDNPFSIVTVIFYLILGAVFVYFRIMLSESAFLKRNLKRYLFLRNLEKKYKPFLSQYFSFYNSLSNKNKLVFERRVQKFIDIKKYIPRGGIKEITPEMKAMIAGCAVQLTFGYPSVYFRHFWRILIYPDNYYSTITKKYHKGEVNQRGLIVISWKSFKDGFVYPSDGINLGLHEMAHALRLLNIVENEEYNFYDREIMKAFDREAANETIKIINSAEGISLFRNYGITNKDEFFSVAVECFFERPGEFKNYNPELYSILAKILKIDPFNILLSSKKQTVAS
jgi:Mlc titration factor MtfA (ptsG expression regulator)